MPATTPELVARLVELIGALGGYVSPSITIYDDFPETGRGVQAVARIAKGDELLRLPLSLVVTLPLTPTGPDGSDSDDEEAAAFRSIAGLVEQKDDLLALVLMRHRLKSKKHKPDGPGASRDELFAVHAKLLPTTYDSSLFFESPELDALEGSSLHALTFKHMDQLKQDYARLFTAVLSRYPALFPLHKCSFNDYQWALGTIWSRAMDFDAFRCIVPFADFFNHKSQVGTCHMLDLSTQSIKIVAAHDASIGEQVFIDYGPFGNQKLLHLYGFVIENNPHDAVPLYIQPPPVLTPLAKKALEIHQLPAGTAALFSLTRTAPVPPALLTYLRILLGSDRDLARIAAKTPTALEDSDKELTVIESLRSSISAMLDAFPNPKLESDLGRAAEALRAQPSASTLRRRHCALYLCQSERQILAGALEELTAMLPE